MELSFTKMQGCANDYIYLDCRTAGVPENIAALSEKLSRRHFSIGADGIICICAPRTAGADAMMRIFNADGSEGRMCGNGIRCVAEWLYTHGIAKETLAIDTLSGLKTVTRKGAGLWQVEMGAYSAMPADLPAVNMGDGALVDKTLTVDGKDWQVTCISVGNPHCVTVVEDVDSLKLEGRAKSAYYAAIVTGAYRHAIDAHAAGVPLDPVWRDEVEHISHRHYSTGFYFGQPGQFTQDSRYIRDWQIVAKVRSCTPDGRAVLTLNNKFSVGDQLELVGPGLRPCPVTVKALWDEDGERLDQVRKPQMVFQLDLPCQAPPLSLLRRRADLTP